MAQRTVTDEIKFSDNELWKAMEFQVMDLVSDRAVQYLTARAVQDHVDESIDKYFSRIKEIIEDDPCERESKGTCPETRAQGNGYINPENLRFNLQLSEYIKHDPGS